MKRNQRIIALALAVLTIASLLSGCNRSKNKDSSNMPAYIYNAEYNKLNIDAEEYYITNAAVGPDAIYMLVNVMDGEEEVFYTDWDENGNTIQSSYMHPKYVSRLFKASIDGKSCELLSDFEYEQKNVNSDTEYSYSYINTIFVTNDGLPGIIYNESTTVFELPESFDPETDNKWEYNSSTTSIYYYMTFDKATGKASEPKEIARAVDGEGMSVEYLAIDGGGNNYLSNWSGLRVYSPDFERELFASKENIAIGSLIRMADGRVAATVWGDKGMECKPFDLAKGKFGDPLTVPATAYEMFPGAGDYALFSRSSSGIVGIKADGTFEETVNWIDSDIDYGGIYSIRALESGDFVCVCDNYGDDGSHSVELVKLTRAPYDPDAERQVITMACMGVNYYIRMRVIDFNKTNTQYRIRMADYSQYNTGDDSSAGVTKLNTEIIAGHIPDIFCLSTNIPANQYAGKGVFEDLTPYIEKEFGKDALVEDFFKTLRSDDGKLYEIYGAFMIDTAVGLESIVGDGSSWTFADMNAAMEKLPAGATVLNEYYNREAAAEIFLYSGASRFVDWQTGKCSFDSAEFIDLLNFVKSFKTAAEVEASHGNDYTYEEEYTRLNSGKQLLSQQNIYDFNEYRANTYYVLNGAPSFVGYPGSGSRFSSSYMSGFAVSSKSQFKDAAWDFIKYILSEEYQSENMWFGLPTNKAVFEKMLAEAKTPTYSGTYEEEKVADGDTVFGNPMYSDESYPDTSEKYSDYNKGSTDGQGRKEEPKTYSWQYDYATGEEWNIPVFAMTDAEEQALRALMSGITTFYRSDTSLRGIIDEETQSFFNGQKSAEETAKMIQSRATIYVNEQK